MDLTMQNLIYNFEAAKNNNFQFVGVLIEMQGFEEPEVIINPSENFDAKLEYYKKAYNDNLTLKAFNGIKIVGFTYGDSFEDIQDQLLG